MAAVAGAPPHTEGEEAERAGIPESTTAAGVVLPVPPPPLPMARAANQLAGVIIGGADVRQLVVPGKRQTLTLQLPGQALLSGDTLQGVFFDNVETIVTNEVSHGR